MSIHRGFQISVSVTARLMILSLQWLQCLSLSLYSPMRNPKNCPPCSLWYHPWRVAYLKLRRDDVLVHRFQNKKNFWGGAAIQSCVAFHSIIPSMELTFGKHSGDPEQINFQGLSATFESTDAQIAASTTNYCASKAPKTDPTKDFCNCILYFFSLPIT